MPLEWDDLENSKYIDQERLDCELEPFKNLPVEMAIANEKLGNLKTGQARIESKLDNVLFTKVAGRFIKKHWFSIMLTILTLAGVGTGTITYIQGIWGI